MAKVKKEKLVVAVPDDYHMVVYTDGGCNPNPSPNAGYGVHGYTYRESGVNINKYRLTKRASVSGYANDTIPESDRASALDVLNASGMVSPGVKTTNNAAELMALTQGLELGLLYKPSDGNGNLLSILFFIDSMYTIKCLEMLTKHLRKGNRLATLVAPRPDGSIRANLDLLTDLLRLVEKYESLNIPISVKWVKGHDGNVGNEVADTFATMGVRQATQYGSRSAWLYSASKQHHYRWCDARSFWRERDGLHLLVDHVNVVYTNDMAEYVPATVSVNGQELSLYLLSTEAEELRAEKKAPPGTGEASDIEEDEDLEEDLTKDGDDDSRYPKVAGRLAHMKAATTRAIVLLDNRLSMVDGVTSIYRDVPTMRDSVLNDLILVKVNKLYSEEILMGYAVMGNDMLELQDNALDHATHYLARSSLAYRGDYIALHVKPQKVSHYMLDHYVEIYQNLSRYLAGDYSHFAGVEDITHLYYNKEADVCELRADRKVGFKRAVYEHSTTVYLPEGEKQPLSLKLVLVNSLHLPCRNALKRIEKYNPRVTLVSTLLSYTPDSFASYRFFVVIETNIGIGCYDAEASNLVLKIFNEG